jgi:rod shape-determining protein MreC
MNNILSLFSRRGSLFLLALYITLSVLLMNFNDPETLRGIRIVVMRAASWITSVEHKLVFLEHLQQENEVLRKRNLDLFMSNQRLQEVMIENIRLRRLLQFKREGNFKYISANVVGFGEEQTVRSLILNVGAVDSVRKNMAVVNDQGLVGKIYSVDTHQSIAQILMDRNTLVSARLQKSREVGVVAWSGNLWLDLNYIPKDIPVEIGESVITSGLSRIYPHGIKVGVVGEVKDDKYALFKEIKIKPAVNFNSLEEVFILVPADSLAAEGSPDE